jgi:methionyl-tRNA formyltransferase
VTGASVFQLVAALDAGDVFAESRYAVPETATAGDVLDALAQDGARLLHGVVDAIADGTAVAAAQSGEPTFAPKLDDDDGRIRWAETRDAVLGRIRGVTPEPGAHTTVDGARLKVLAAAAAPVDAPELEAGELVAHGGALLIGTGSAPIVLHRVQPAGKTAMDASDWWRGRRVGAESVRAGT